MIWEVITTFEAQNIQEAQPDFISKRVGAIEAVIRNSGLELLGIRMEVIDRTK